MFFILEVSSTYGNNLSLVDPREELHMETLTKQYYVFGTIVDIEIETTENERILQQIVSTLYDLQHKLTAFNPESEINMINQLTPTEISSDTYKILEQSLFLAKQTAFAFNPFLGKIMKNHRQNKKLEIQALDEPILELDSLLQTALFRTEDAIDLGAIGKGFAADTIFELLQGVSGNVKLNLGGHVMLYSSEQKLTPIGIQHPLYKQGVCITSIALPSNYSIVTSGTYERIYQAGHHIINPETGLPTTADLVSVSLIIPSYQNAIADAISTALMVMGKTAAEIFMNNHYPDIGYLFITNELIIVQKHSFTEFK